MLTHSQHVSGHNTRLIKLFDLSSTPSRPGFSHQTFQIVYFNRAKNTYLLLSTGRLLDISPRIVTFIWSTLVEPEPMSHVFFLSLPSFSPGHITSAALSLSL